MLLFHLFLLGGILGRSFADNKRCYYPDGSEAKDDFPCDPDAEDSVCCGGSFGSVCYSNKLCSNQQQGNTVRGACTDDEWTSPECPYFCLGAATGGTDLVSCANVTDSGASFCCDHNNGCCDSGVGRFNVFPAEPEVWATFNTRSSRFIVVKTDVAKDKTQSTSVPASTTSSSTAESTTSVSIPKSTSETISKDTSSAEATTTSTTETSAASGNTADPAGGKPSGPDSGLSTPAIAGIAAGSGVAVVLAVVAAAFLIWRRHRRNKDSQQGLPGNGIQPPPSFYSGHYNGNAYPPQYIPKEAQYHPQELHGHQPHAQFERAELPVR